MKRKLSGFIKTDLFLSITIVLVWRIIVELFAIFTLHRLPLSNVIHEPFYQLQVWTNWDGGQFIGIARDNYLDFQYAFFPLLPLLIKIISTPFTLLFGTKAVILTLSALTVTTVSLIALYFLIKLGELDKNRDSGIRAGLLLLFFPASIFLAAVYTEPLFLACATGSFYYAKKKNWLLSALFASGATLTRLLGLWLLPCLLLEFYLQKNKGDKGVLWLTLMPLALASYMLYQYVQIGNPFAFLEMQKLWNREFNPAFLPAIVEQMQIGLDLTHFNEKMIAPMYDSLAILFGLAGAGVLVLMKQYPYALYVLGMTVIPLTSGQIYSMIRFDLVLFPLFLILGKWGKNHIAYSFMIASFALFCAILSIHYLNIWWLA